MHISNMKLKIDLTNTQLHQLRLPLKWYWLILQNNAKQMVNWQTLETKTLNPKINPTGMQKIRCKINNTHHHIMLKLYRFLWKVMGINAKAPNGFFTTKPRRYGVQRRCQSHKLTAFGAFQSQEVSLIDVGKRFVELIWLHLIW